MRHGVATLLLTMAWCSPAFAEQFPGEQACIIVPPNAPAGACEANVETMASDWKQANAGDYQAQRNVAFCFGNGCFGAVAPNVVASCAWRIVILEMHPATIDATDVANARSACSRIGSTLRADAVSMAGRLLRSLTGKKPDLSDY